jgi:hypothetical protein
VDLHGDGACVVQSCFGHGVVSVVEPSQRQATQDLAEPRASSDYATDRWIYIYYSTDTDNRVARLRLGEDPSRS